jgi:hypothetical protein
VFSDRYHAHALRTPRETRAGLRYVLLNGHHHTSHVRRGAAYLDPCSSAASFDGWSRPCALPPGWLPDPLQIGAGQDVRRDSRYVKAEPISATVGAKTWLLRVGWRKAGDTISPDEVPG